eukprot:767904-Hanusia_phi.AAC.3
MADDEAIGKMIDNFAPGQVAFLLARSWAHSPPAGHPFRGSGRHLAGGDSQGSVQGADGEQLPPHPDADGDCRSRQRKSLSRKSSSLTLSRRCVLSGAETKAKVYPAALGDSVDEIKREGAVCVVDLIGYKKNVDGSKVGQWLVGMCGSETSCRAIACQILQSERTSRW